MTEAAPRRYRHRGARRATGGTWTPPPGEEREPASAGPREEPAHDDAGTAPAAPSRDAGAPDREAGAPLDERGRWLLEERPPHWG